MNLRSLLAGVLLLATTAFAQAADWPTRPVKLVVPSGPGSSPDIFARLLAASLQQRTGQTFVVENRGGASGNLGMDAVAKSPSDGATLGIAFPAPLTTNTVMMKKMPFDVRRDLQLVTNAVLQPTVLVVGKHLEVNNFAEFAALMRKNPGKYNSASTGAASLGRLLAEALASAVGTKVENVVYNGAAPTMVALTRGDVDFAFLPAAGSMSFAQSGRVTLLAIAGDKRSSLLPNVPTLKELGHGEVDGSNWLGIVAPGGLPADVAARVRQEVLAALNTADTRKLLAESYMEVIGSTPAEFAQTVADDTRRWKPLIERLALTID
ncbi:tripartite tricarboxylate transporter substrate binding protein [Aquabacterium sp. J223]|uniref:Bug family tripartite tricarboxylate transporter substrate binding protein n=1 Tax=Aquabacterium sp. J223 TaxID=2898431 RepID=UPI0021AD8711|nr:tripartite tricarboxylate transporter substrate binding protein [Aquabacterium sp. J223]UUX95476.1 tripartite tricarboxylate transporter substrate binding protein [Aquabacterium sp. J223]